MNYIKAIDDLNDLQQFQILEYTYQTLDIECINEGVVESIKTFFKQIWKFIKDLWDKFMQFIRGFKKGFNDKADEDRLKTVKDTTNKIPNFSYKLETPITREVVNSDEYKKIDSIMRELKNRKYDYDITPQNIDQKYNDYKKIYDVNIFEYYKTSKEEIDETNKFFKEEKIYELNNNVIDDIDHNIAYYKRTSKEADEDLKIAGQKVKEIQEKTEQIPKEISPNESNDYYIKLKKLYLMYTDDLASYILILKADTKIREKAKYSNVSCLNKIYNILNANKDKIKV